MKDRAVSKSALAAELKCSPSSISALVAKGLPTREDGRLDRLATLRWIVQYTSGFAGGWGIGGRVPGLHERAGALLAGQVPQAKARPKPSVGIDHIPTAFAVARALCTSLRASLPGLLADLLPDTADLNPTAAANICKIVTFAEVDFLMRGWSAEVFECAGKAGLEVSLPEIDWSPFGKDAAAMKRLFEVEQALLRGDDSDPDEVLQIPDGRESEKGARNRRRKEVKGVGGGNGTCHAE